jgi:Uncharacterized conserved protein (DUF2190)
MPVSERYYKPGQDITCHANVGLTGGRAVAIVANRQSGPGLSASAEGSNYVVGLPADAGRIFGVAGHDAAAGADVVVYRDGIVAIESSGTINAFQEVEIGADGRVEARSTGIPVGVCMSGVTVGQFAEVELYKSGSIA